MRLYFQAGEKHRIAIDFGNQVYCIDYSMLGGYKEYIKISMSDYKQLLKKCVNENYAPNWYA